MQAAPSETLSDGSGWQTRFAVLPDEDGHLAVIARGLSVGARPATMG